MKDKIISKKKFTMSAFSVFIPSVYKNITAAMISETFHRMDVGKVKHIDLVSKNENQNKAYVYFDALYQSDRAMSIYNDVKDTNSSKLQYGKSEHVYWILLENRNQYDGVSCVGEYNEPEFTDEEIAFMESHLQTFDVMDQDYVEHIESELANMRNAYSQMQLYCANLQTANILFQQKFADSMPNKNIDQHDPSDKMINTSHSDEEMVI